MSRRDGTHEISRTHPEQLAAGRSYLAGGAGRRRSARRLGTLTCFLLAAGCGSESPEIRAAEAHPPPPQRTLDLLQMAASRGTPNELVSVGERPRRALVLSAPATRWLPEVPSPAGSILHFDYAAVDGDPAGALLRVRIGTPASSAVVFEQEIEPGAARWRRVAVGMPENARGRLHIALEVIPRPTGDPPEPTSKFAFADLVLLPPDSASSESSSVILISLDTTRADHLSIYGYPKDTTPFLRELARESAVYERAYTPSTWTLPSHASLLTGLFPSQHGATTGSGPLGARALPGDVLTLAEVLGSMGYLTMGVVGSPYLSRSFGMDQGFALYSDLWVGHKRPAEDTNEVALGWVRLAGKRPFFLFLNYVDAHAPFAPPGYDVDDSHLFEPLGIDIETFQWAAMRKLKLTDLPDETAAALVERYDAGILAQDSALRTLFEELDRLGVLERSVVVVVADHGESFGEGQMWGHGGLSIDPQSRVPLLYRSPARPELAGTRDAEPISIVEIPSMILRDLAAPDPDRLSGGRSARAPVYGERFSEHGSMRMLMEGSHKYLLRIRVGEDATRIERVYDVASDPEEKVNLAQTDPQKLGELRSHYREILESLGLADEGTSVEAVPPAHERTPEDVALREQLRALGYLD